MHKPLTYKPYPNTPADRLQLEECRRLLRESGPSDGLWWPWHFRHRDHRGPEKWNEMTMQDKTRKCPHCGKLFDVQDINRSGALIPTHDYPPPCRSVCPGSGQFARNAETDHRPLWKDLK